MFAHGVSIESGATFIPVKIPSLIHGNVGESEKSISNLFQDAKKRAPAILFLDEIDSLFSSEDGELNAKMCAQLTSELDNLDVFSDRVVILAATNHVESIMPSLIRSGRIERLIKVDLPSEQDRNEILKMILDSLPIQSDQILDLEDLVNQTEGLTGSQLNELVRRSFLDSHSKNKIFTQKDIIYELHNLYRGET